jgi:hypothetical protein
MPADSRDPAPPGQPLAIEALARRKRRDAAAVLPLAGALLFVSPLLDLVAGAGAPFGIPAAVLAVFAGWFALIALTGRLARRLARDDAA